MLDLEKFIGGLHDYMARAMQPLADRIKALEQRAPIPGEKGADGAQGPQGERGEPGPQGEQGPAGERGEKGEPGPAGDTGPPGEKGIDGKDGQPGRDGRDGLPGAQGEKGIDGRDGKDGRDGIDGLGFDDLVVEHDGHRRVTIKFIRGDQEKAFDIVIPATIDAGFYKAGQAYEPGDGVTFGGSYWIAQKATTAKPETGVDDWRLAVKKGRDGKDGERGERGEKGERGLPGMNGKDLR